MEKRITVYTPTYNRAYTLQKGYDALCRQTCQDFQWIIVDDGSTDDTKQIVNQWIAENKINIKYIYQENQGVNVARNTAVKNIETELCVMVDSDDYLVDDAIEKILRLWDENIGKGYIGIIAMDKDTKGNIIGKPIPENLSETTLTNLYENLGIIGDKKTTYLTALCKKYPNRVIPGEKYYPSREKFYKMDREGPCLVLHEAICIVEYLPDGITASRYKRYLNNPIGFSKYRIFLMENNPKIKNIIKQVVHFDAMKCISTRKIKLKDSGHPALALVLYPLGAAWAMYIKHNSK